MKLFFFRKQVWIYLAGALLVACSADFAPRDASSGSAAPVRFGAEISLGRVPVNPAVPFLRAAPDGRLFAVWTEDSVHQQSVASDHAAHQSSGKMAPSPLRHLLIASSTDGGTTWSSAKRINRSEEAIQAEENGPKIAFSPDNRAYAVWSIPGAKGDKTRANIRFAMEDGKGGFGAARTLNEVKDAARFPIVEFSPAGNLLIAWIDRRMDSPQPRQLYLMKIAADGQAITKNYSAGEGLCECCKLGIAFADSGKTVYIVDRQVNEKQIRNHVLRTSTDGGATFGAPVEISNDAWQVGSCPHSGPSLGRDSRGWLHVSWFTLGRSENEAGIYYSMSKDGGKTFAPRRLVQANTAPEVLYNNLIVGADNTVYLAWTNLDPENRAQIFFRTIGADGRWSEIQQLSQAKGDANRPTLALSKNRLHVAWTEIDGETSRAVLRSAPLSQ